MGNEVDKPCCSKSQMQEMLDQQKHDSKKSIATSKSNNKKSIRNMVGTQQSFSIEEKERKMTEFSDFNNKLSRENIYDVFHFGKILGNGKFGIVRIA